MYLVKPVQSEEILLALTRLSEKPVSMPFTVDDHNKGKKF